MEEWRRRWEKENTSIKVETLTEIYEHKELLSKLQKEYSQYKSTSENKISTLQQELDEMRQKQNDESKIHQMKMIELEGENQSYRKRIHEIELFKQENTSTANSMNYFGTYSIDERDKQRSHALLLSERSKCRLLMCENMVQSTIDMTKNSGISYQSQQQPPVHVKSFSVLEQPQPVPKE